MATGSTNNATSLFKRKEIIGRGKFGVVYKAYHVKTQQVYAIKVLNLDNTEDEVEDIRKEIQFLSSLKQAPNITHYYGSYLNDTKLWVIMEYCAGGSLRTLLRPGVIEEKYIGVIMREILVALVSIHRDNVIHRDIKAANILISNNGSVKLCDFGVAAQLSQSMLKRQTMAGTPYWMAPEVIMEGVYYDTKVDIWSLGITAYEIATGNPPYCHMEAIRAMQMITKSKPPRLEGREYSQPLKEFIALCLDEDPRERPSAEDLSKSKLIKQERGTSTSVLRELITRYLLFREKNEHYKQEEEQNQAKRKSNSSLDANMWGSSNENSQDEIDIKWDFDSLSSKEYILENDINVEAIPEEADWIKYSPQEVNYAYPEEDYYNSNKPYFPYYQGSTIGRTFNNNNNNTNTNNNNNPNTNNNTNTNNNPGTAQLSTMHAMNPNTGNGNGNNNNIYTTNANSNIATNQHNSHFTKHYQQTATGTANHYSRHTGTTTHGTSKRSETKASKQLLQLFDDKPEEVYDFPKLSKTVSSFSIQPNAGGGHAEHDNDGRPDIRNVHSQSTPALSILQTNFKTNMPGAGSSSVLPTPIEIEIPEELPVTKESSITMNMNMNMNSTKPRSATVSSMTHKTTPALQRRPTVSGQPSAQLAAYRSDVSSGASSVPAGAATSMQANSGPSLLPMGAGPGAGTGTGTNTGAGAGAGAGASASVPAPAGISTSSTGNGAASMGNGGYSNMSVRSPSPTRGSNGVSPEKKILDAVQHQSSIYSNTPPVMKQLQTSSDILLQSMNSPMDKKGKEEEPSRINRDFKKQHPNLKLQMPSPTTLVGSNKLLDGTSHLEEGSGGGGGGNSGSASAHPHSSTTAQTVNQFGINTSNAQISVAMTPVAEKRFGDLKPRKRSTSASTSSRNNSITNEHGGSLGMLGAPGVPTIPAVPAVPAGAGAGASVQAQGVPISASVPAQINTGTANTSANVTATNAAATNTTASTTPGNASGTAPAVAVVSASVTPSTGLMMDAPPKSLSMDMFIDVPDDHRADRKPTVLSELDTLLKLFEDGLTVMELTLRNSLPQDSPEEE